MCLKNGIPNNYLWYKATNMSVNLLNRCPTKANNYISLEKMVFFFFFFFSFFVSALHKKHGIYFDNFVLYIIERDLILMMKNYLKK